MWRVMLAQNDGQDGLDKLQELRAIGDLPSPKGAALAIMRLTRKEDVSISQLVPVVQTDPALVGRIIKAANTSQQGAHRKIVSVQDALILLGIPTVRYLALSFSLLSDHRNGKCPEFDYRRFWSHSLACGVALQAIAGEVRSAPPEEAFSLGLLCRIGELALATAFPAEYGRLLSQVATGQGVKLLELEHARLAMTHADLSAALLKDWGLPRMFIDAVQGHERPETLSLAPESRDFNLVWALVLARQIADVCLSADADRRGLMPELFLRGSKLSLEGSKLVELCDRVARDWQVWAGQLNVDAHAVPPFADMSAPPPAPEISESGMPSTGDTEEPLRVLVVDDDRSIRTLVKALLKEGGYIAEEAATGQAGFEKAIEFTPHIVITDWMMPEMDGIELTRALRQTRQGRAVYIIILTSLDAETKLIEAFDAGVDDFLTKPLNPRVLGARLRAGQRVVTLQQELERDREEIRRFAAELAVSNRRLQDAALTDVLTGFPNRRYAIERFQQEWQSSTRSKRPLACMMIDVDNFKTINDTHGHDVGNVVLRQTAQAIKSGLRAQDVVCRTGGDEFIVICPETDLTAALACGERVRKAVAAMRVRTGSLDLTGSVSVGVAIRDDQTVDIDALIKRADEAVYAAKHQGRNRVSAVQSP